MVFKSLHGLAPPYMRNLFTKTSQLTSRNLRNSATDLRIPKKNSTNGQKCYSFSEVLNLGMASQPSVSRYPLFINSKTRQTVGVNMYWDFILLLIFISDHRVLLVFYENCN